MLRAGGKKIGWVKSQASKGEATARGSNCIFRGKRQEILT